MHRFIWDLSYPLPKSVRSSLGGPAGVQAVPGNYTVKLTANGKSSTQPLTIKLDPRVKTPPDGLARQFGLASKLAARLEEVSMALQQAGDFRKQLDARKREAGSNVGLLTALQGLEKNVEAAAEPDSDADFGLFALAAPGMEHEPLPQVAAALSGLLRIVEGADGAPASDAAVASEGWEKAAQETFARWTAFQRDDLASVNALLRKANLKPLIVEESTTPH